MWGSRRRTPHPGDRPGGRARQAAFWCPAPSPGLEPAAVATLHLGETHSRERKRFLRLSPSDMKKNLANKGKKVKSQGGFQCGCGAQILFFLFILT